MKDSRFKEIMKNLGQPESQSLLTALQQVAHESVAEFAKNIASKKDVEVVIRWFDGYLEKFECKEVRFGSDLLWMRLSDGKNRHIPVRQVRWYSITPESHESTI